jgi:hypothetical protein
MSARWRREDVKVVFTATVFVIAVGLVYFIAVGLLHR